MLVSNIDLEPTESGVFGEKGIVNDIVFLIRDKRDNINKVTINLELQGKNPLQGKKEKRYSVVTRAVYYAAKLLSSTIHRGDNYSEIHKVYSVWFCNFNIDKEIEKYDEIEDREIHRFKICRAYEDIGKSAIDEVADLLEATIVEIPKLKGKEGEGLAEAVYQILKDFGNARESILEATNIDIEEFKEVERMFDFDGILQKATERAMAEGREEGMEQGMAQGRTEGRNQALIESNRRIASKIITREKDRKVALKEIKFMLDISDREAEELLQEVM